MRKYLRPPLVLDGHALRLRLSGVAALIVLPFDFYVGYFQAHAAGWSHQTLPNWLKGEGVPLAVRLVVASLLIWLPYRLIARSPRRWWLYCALALIPVAFLALVALPVWVDPLTTSYKPLDDRPLETRIEALAARCGVTNIPVFVGGDSTRVDGLGPTNRIVLQSNLASVETPDQIEFTIGHELKHYVMGDNWKALAIIAAFLLAAFWLTDRLGRAAIRRFSRRWGFSELSDPASLPLIVFMLTVHLACHFAVFQSVLPPYRARSRPLRPRIDSSKSRGGDDIRQGCSNRSCARLGYFLPNLPGDTSLHSPTDRIRQHL